jgi:uncharacterized membrane protein (UPF0127 family)
VRRLAVAAAAILALSCASKKGPETSPGPRVVVETGDGARHAVAVELARTDAERSRGLMHRTSLPEDGGMLFLFDETAEHSFWMQNTFIPLDMIFVDDEGRIVGIVERAEPETTRMRSVGAPSRYVLEVNGGWARARGVKRGDRVRFEIVPRF